TRTTSSFDRRLFRHYAAAAALAARAALAFLEHEGRRGALGDDGRAGLRVRFGLDGDVADVDDPGELADAIEEVAEIVIRAFGLQLERQVGVERLLLLVLRREAADREVRLGRQPLDAAEDVGDVLFLRQDRSQALQLALELGDLRLELGQPPRRGDALGDV